MSSWQLPTRKGTELFPQTTKVPVAVRIIGLDPADPMSNEFLMQHYGQLRQFYQRHMQNYSLSPNPQMNIAATLPGGLTVQYRNLMGMEQLIVRVPPSLRQKRKLKTTERTQDWQLSPDTVLIALHYGIPSGYFPATTGPQTWSYKEYMVLRDKYPLWNVLSWVSWPGYDPVSETNNARSATGIAEWQQGPEGVGLGGGEHYLAKLWDNNPRCGEPVYVENAEYPNGFGRTDWWELLNEQVPNFEGTHLPRSVVFWLPRFLTIAPQYEWYEPYLTPLCNKLEERGHAFHVLEAQNQGSWSTIWNATGNPLRPVEGGEQIFTSGPFGYLGRFKTWRYYEGKYGIIPGGLLDPVMSGLEADVPVWDIRLPL